MTVTSWQDLRAKNTTFGRLIPGLGFVVVGEEEAVGVKLPETCGHENVLWLKNMETEHIKDDVAIREVEIEYLFRWKNK